MRHVRHTHKNHVRHNSLPNRDPSHESLLVADQDDHDTVNARGPCLVTSGHRDVEPWAAHPSAGGCEA